MSKQRRKGCSACKGLGFILADNDVHGIRIERCDECCTFNSDALAVEYVYAQAQRQCKSVLRPDILDQLNDVNATPSVLRDMSSSLVHVNQVMANAADEIYRLRKLIRKKTK